MKNSIRFLQIADWGGISNNPFYTPSQLSTAIGMKHKADELNMQFVVALGDNFYDNGISGTCFDPRFSNTWENVYNMSIPWYVNAGNHDHRGNVSSQIEYSNINKYWVFPSLYHKHTFYSDDGSVSLDIILIDTTNYTGVNDNINYPSNVYDIEQHTWIENALSQSKADYIIVGGHYPVYSVCDHGNTQTLINNLSPLLEKYQAHYMSGHDHCAEHLVVNDVNYWLNGIGHGCCYMNSNIDVIPVNSLRYYIANTLSYSIDDDKVEQGVNGTIGGYTSVIITSKQMMVTFYNQNNEVLYESSTQSRRSMHPLYLNYLYLFLLTTALSLTILLYYVNYSNKSNHLYYNIDDLSRDNKKLMTINEDDELLDSYD